MRDITSGDCLQLRHIEVSVLRKAPASRTLFYTLLKDLGDFPPGAPATGSWAAASGTADPARRGAGTAIGSQDGGMGTAGTGDTRAVRVCRRYRPGLWRGGGGSGPLLSPVAAGRSGLHPVAGYFYVPFGEDDRRMSKVANGMFWELSGPVPPDPDDEYAEEQDDYDLNDRVIKLQGAVPFVDRHSWGLSRGHEDKLRAVRGTVVRRLCGRGWL
ncbi:hypothetical protein [Streptomyces sp. NPDC001100]